MKMSRSVVIIFAILFLHETLSHPRWDNQPEDLDDYNRVVFPDIDEDYYPTGWHHTTADGGSFPINNIEACVSSCPETPYNPVCGTDDVTYQNIDRLRCVVRCGHDIQVKQWSECKTQSRVNPTTSRNNLRACIDKCPATSEYLPVCGTDNITYNNVGKLNCAKTCGVAVEVKRRAPCPRRPLPTTTTPASTSSPSSINRIQKCISLCPVTPEYNPVCGSDDVTYTNIGQLECARECGVDVSLRSRTACFQLTSTTSPLLSSKPTTLSTLPFPSMTTKSSGFTIPQDILDSIFTRPAVHDEDEEPDIDARNNSD